MRILFIGDYSNLHATLASELKKRGHKVTVLSDKGEYIGSHADIFLKRKKSLFGGFRYLYDIFSLLPDLKDYDVVQFINPNFFHLRPGKIKYFFDRIKAQNNKLFLTIAGNDYYFCKACMEGEIFRFSEFKIGEEFSEFHKSEPHRLYGWTSYENKHWNEYFYANIDGAMSVLPEYDMVAKKVIPEKTVFTNLPIDLSILPYPSYKVEYPVKIFLGIRSGMEIQKGVLKLKKIAKEIEDEMPGKVIFETVSDIPLREFISRMNFSHIVLDQLYAYSPATTALMAMGMGKVAATGAQPEYYEYINNPKERPVISLSPFEKNIKDKIIEVVNNPDEIQLLGRQARKLVEENNEVGIVADRFIKHWKKYL